MYAREWLEANIHTRCMSGVFIIFITELLPFLYPVNLQTYCVLHEKLTNRKAIKQNIICSITKKYPCNTVSFFLFRLIDNQQINYMFRLQ